MQVALSLACMMMKQYFIHICICMQQEVAGIYICEMQLLTCNLFHCKIEISLFYSFILFHFVLFTNAVERTKNTTTLALVIFYLNLFYFKFVFLWRAQDGRLFYLDYLIKEAVTKHFHLFISVHPEPTNRLHIWRRGQTHSSARTHTTIATRPRGHNQG